MAILPVCVPDSLRTGVFVAFVAKNAVVNFAEDFAVSHARIRQSESVPAPQPFIGTEHRFGKVGFRALYPDKIKVVDGFRESEADPVFICRIVQVRGTPLHQQIQGIGNIRRSAFGLHQINSRDGGGHFGIELSSRIPLGVGTKLADVRLEYRRICWSTVFFQRRNDPPPHEIHFESKNGVLIGSRRCKCVHFLGDAEQAR